MRTPLVPVLLFLLAIALIGVGWFSRAALFPCPRVSEQVVEDSIAARDVVLDSIAMENAIRQHLIDSLANLPSPDERLPATLDFVRSARLEQQLDSALSDPR